MDQHVKTVGAVLLLEEIWYFPLKFTWLVVIVFVITASDPLKISFWVSWSY